MAIEPTRLHTKLQHSQGSEYSEINLVDYLRVVRERKWYLITTLVIIVTLGIIYSIKATPIFRSTSNIEISPYFPTTFKTDEYYRPPRNTYEYAHYSKTKIADLQSFSIAGKVNDLLERKDISGYNKEKLTSMIEAQAQPETYLWTLSVEGEQEDHIQAILETYIKVFMDDNVKKRHEASREILHNITLEKNRLESQKKNVNQKILIYKKNMIEEHDIYLKPDINEEAAMDLARINTDLEKTKSTSKKLVAVLNEFEENIKKTGVAVPSSLEGLHWPAIENQKKQHLAAYTEHKALEEKYGKNHPRLIEARREVDSIMQNMQETIKSEISIQQAKTDLLRGEKNKQYKKIQTLETIFPAYIEMYDEFTSIKTNLEGLNQQILELQPNIRDTANNIRVIDPPSTAKKVKPNMMINVILSVILGMLLGVGLAFLREYIDRSIKSIHHFEHIFDSPVIGVIPYIKKNVQIKEAVVSTDEHSIYADVFRLLRTKLVYLNQESPDIKVFLVTSPNPQEGKTLIATNLALSFQKTNKKILLIEGDMWKPKIKKTFELLGHNSDFGSHGLSNILDNSAQVENVTYSLDNGKENMDLLLAGDSVHSASEIISPENFSEFIGDIKNQYDFIIIDSPPINEKADGAVMASCSDAVIMIVKRGVTSWESAGNAKRILSDIQANISGGILNVTTSGRYYGPYGMYKTYYYDQT